MCGAGVWCLLFFAFSARAQGWQWALGPGLGNGISTAFDAAGNSYVAGNYTDTLRFGAFPLNSSGNEEVFVAKLSPAGTGLWAARVSGAPVYMGGIAVDGTGDVIVAGYFQNGTAVFGSHTLTATDRSLFVAKLSSGGIWQWAVSSAAGSTTANAVALAPNGDIVLTGELLSSTATVGSSVLTTNGDVDLLVARLTSGGTWLWALNAGGVQADFGTDIAVDAAGNLVVASLYYSTVRFGPDTLAYADLEDFAIAKLTGTGTWLWGRSVSTTATDDAHLAVDSNGDILVVGSFRDTLTLGPFVLPFFHTGSIYSEAYVGKLSGAGTWLWATRSTGIGSKLCTDVALDAADNIVVIGGYNNNSVLGPFTLSPRVNAPGAVDIFVAKLTSTGTWQWVLDAGDIEYDAAIAVAVDANDNIVVTGGFLSERLPFGNVTLTQQHRASTVFVARISPVAMGLTDLSPSTPLGAYPIPAHCTVQLTGLVPGSKAILYDSQGRAVLTTVATAATSALNIQALRPGLYTVRAGTTSRRIVIE